MASQSTFMTGYTTGPGANFTYNRDSWRRAVADQPNVSPHAIKAAIQREARDRNATVAPALQRDYMKHYYGIGHDRGFMQHMGRWGNLGKSGYESAKAGGFTADDIKSQSAFYGMQMMPEAQALYDADIQSQFDTKLEEQQASFDNTLGSFQTDVADMMKAFTSEPGAPPESTVLRGQSGQMKARKGRLAGAGTNQFKRGYTPKKNMMNLGIAANKGTSGSLNIG